MDRATSLEGKDLAKAIPLRFRQPSGRSAYDRARIVTPAAPVLV